MTEITDDPLPEAIDAFVLHWGEMGGRWGVNRSVAQIHAYLYLREKPATAEDIANAFAMARSNVSNSLKELAAWNLVRRVPVRGDRRDHFEAETDPWEIARRIAQGRKERELDPARETLERCLASAKGDRAVTPVQRDRLKALLDFTTDLDRAYGEVSRLPRPVLERMLKLGGRIAALMPKR